MSMADIFSSIQKSKLGIQDWSLSDLTIGLYLLYLRQASKNYVEEVKGELISSESIVTILTIFFLLETYYRRSTYSLLLHMLVSLSHETELSNCVLW